jgi:hypothetical protein
MDNSLLIGAGGYWLADNRRGTQHSGMYYGGFVAGWSVRAGRAVRVGGRALAGFGQATLPTSVTFATGPFPDGHMDLGHDAHGFDPGPVTTTVQQVRFHRGFAILEPQADLTVRLARRIWLDAGGGYRLIGNAGSFESRLRGAFGSVGVRFSAH